MKPVSFSSPDSENAEDISPENMFIGKNVCGDAGPVGNVSAYAGSTPVVSATAMHAITNMTLTLFTLMIPTQIFQLFAK